MAEGERRWIDAQIRWDDPVAELDNDDEDRAVAMDPFADPHPQETFVFSEDNPVDATKPIDMRLEGFKANADQVWQSTGLTVWKAAYELSRYLLRHPDVLQGNRVLELGAGLGLCGILAHQLQSSYEEGNDAIKDKASSVMYITDGDTEALAKLRGNAAANQRSEQILCHQLLWGREQAEAFAHTHGTMNVLLASDIVYVSTIVRPLWETVQVLLKADGLFLFAFDSRRDVPVTIEYVLQEAEAAGFVYEALSNDLYTFRWRATS